MIELFAGRILIFIFHPAVTLREGDFLNFPAILAASPVLFVNPVLADLFRMHQMSHHIQVTVKDEGVEVALVKFPLRIVDFLQKAFPSILPVEIHGLDHHCLGVLRCGQTLHGRLRIHDWNQR